MPEHPEDPVERTLPLVEERVTIEKRERTAGTVRVRTVVHEEPLEVDEALTATEVDIVRVPADRLVEAPVADRMEGDTLVVSVHREVLVVERRLQVFEELHVTRRERRHAHRETVTLRREEAVVERVDAPETPAER